VLIGSDAMPDFPANRYESAAMTSPTVYFLNGPNANLYGLDKSGTYGRESFVSIKKTTRHRLA
jgi:hypothetical protein